MSRYSLPEKGKEEKPLISPKDFGSLKFLECSFRASVRKTLDLKKTDRLLKKIPEKLRHLLPGTLLLRSAPAVEKIVEVLLQYESVMDFFESQGFYQAFQKEAKALGLQEGFDRYQDLLPFEAPEEKKSLPHEQYVTDLLTRENLHLEPHQFFQEYSIAAIEEAIRGDLERIRQLFLKKSQTEDQKINHLSGYFRSVMLLAKIRYPNFFGEIKTMISEKRFLEALGRIQEFYRDKVGNEIVRGEKDTLLRESAMVLVDQELERINELFSHFDLSPPKETSVEERMITYHLKLDERRPETILRGTISCDCTDVKLDFAFHETIPQHLLDPGFLNFQLFEENDWVGNVYCLVMEVGGKAVLVIDAIQPSINHAFEASTLVIAEKILDVLKTYAQHFGFQNTYLSQFISNRGLLQFYFSKRLKPETIQMRKIGGFDHLKELGLWDENNFRNEYLETFMPGDPNKETQVLPLYLL